MFETCVTQTSLRARAHQRFEVGKLKRVAVLVERPEFQHHAALLQPVPRANIRLVIGNADDDLVARLQLAVQRTGEILQEAGGRGTEDDLFRATRIDEVHGGGAGFGKRAGSGLRHRIAAADLDILFVEEAGDALDGTADNLRSAGIVEKGPAAGQARKLAAHEIEIERLCFSHGLSSENRVQCWRAARSTARVRSSAEDQARMPGAS